MDKTIFGGIQISFGIRGPCNYTCHYCIGQYGRSKRKPVHFDVDWLGSVYDDLATMDGPGTFILTSYECGNSEPTIHPSIRDYLTLQVEHGVVVLPSNCSQYPLHWVPVNHPERISVTAALHPQGETNLDGFLDRMKATTAAGVHIHPQYIAHPDNFPKIRRYEEYFARHGYKLFIRQFRGPHGDKYYPRDYTDDEKHILGILEDATVQTNTPWNRRMIMPTRNFMDIPCLAGQRLLFMEGPSQLRRCLYVKTPIDRPYRQAVPCSIDGCPCGLYLEELNSFTARFWNGWRRVAGWPELPVEPLDQFQEYTRRQETYWKLMERYGKVDANHNLLVGTGMPNDPFRDKPPSGGETGLCDA